MDYTVQAFQPAYEQIQEPQAAPLRVLLDFGDFEFEGETHQPVAESAPEPDPVVADSTAETAGAEDQPGAEDDLLIIPLRPADRRAGDFLTGWVRRFSRA